ncbi:MAG: MerR family transcriptional regulator [Anaeromyxobacteraceae bacterium]
MHADLSSGDLARVTGNTVRTIRFYEEQRLLVPAEVSGGGHRRYTQDDVERLKLISDLRELGLPLGQIRSVLELRAGCHTAAEFAARFQDVLAEHLEQAQKRLDRLRKVKRELQDALQAIQARLEGGPALEAARQCACAVAADRGAPRIVKVLARQPGCCGAPGNATDEGGGGDVPPTGLA